MKSVKKQVVKSTCGLCQGGCSVLVHLKDNKVVSIKGDPESPVNEGVLCAKGRASLEYLYHPDRLSYPLKRAGKKGEGKWTRISWDRALDIIADRFSRSKNQFGPESVSFVQGAAKGLIDVYNERLANAFGTPNLTTSGHVCFLPRFLASKLTCGFYPLPDYQHPPACIVVWGANLGKTRIGEYKRIIKQLQRGTKLMVVDPVQTDLARKAQTWLQLKPGSDLPLALGMIQVIIAEERYHKTFVQKRTTGFQQLKEFINEYPPQRVSSLTWIPGETIKKAARFYAQHKPACIQWGNAVDHGVNSFQTARAISILRAITGNLDVPGGDIEPTYPLKAAGSLDLPLWDKKKWMKRIDADYQLLPLFHRVLPRNLVRAILEEKPYPVRNMYIHASNPLLTFDNSEKTYNALKKLEFLVVSDLFMTPTAALADIVLPTATYLEYDNISITPYYPAAQIQQKVAAIGQCRSDFEIVNELAKRLGLNNYFWENLEDFFDMVLQSSGITFAELKEKGILIGTKEYRKFEKRGFQTSSGKVELYSNQLETWGFDPLPVYNESREALASQQKTEEYPFTLTSQKPGFYIHSSGRQIQSLRAKHPGPCVHIHPETAKPLGIRQGDRLVIETKTGRIEQNAFLSSRVAPGVVLVDFGWWFPEAGISSLYEFTRSNVNMLTDNGSAYNREIGSGMLRGMRCRVYKA
ncbi:MAG: molybdopterin-dependent oxidoreductase [Candidatus Aminicenantes bacterium]|nr:molybdopterin-dependent oxidoreductase [Candidatus Aminicenantes bacterium]NIM79315.1 molybdopterin-dependent oxidoreductase [Candidatus Aminicenantes bacterium]NIN18592.1 molybdopterin-dependent oxidoreductase [Candidatus Aminicenantes bacterium]NIN42481.1 molybdopterin-dependent oxidoreductase [Candidatus Aminicenantes bacterium]NIN85247.1 molybdopterin-dependent oxidoreductase [Candidatus Aminicenantes bacterium]